MFRLWKRLLVVASITEDDTLVQTCGREHQRVYSAPGSKFMSYPLHSNAPVVVPVIYGRSSLSS